MFSKGILYGKTLRSSPAYIFRSLNKKYVLAFLVILLSFVSENSIARIGIEIDVFKDISSCKYSPKGKKLQPDCNTIAEAAASLSDSLVWPFKTVKECYKHYGLDKCYANRDGYLSVKPSGFAFIHKGKGIAFPVYESISLGSGRIVLPNGYEVEKGTSNLPSSIGNEQLVNISKANSLEKRICVSFSQGKKCDSISNLLNLPSRYHPDILNAIANN